MAGVYPLSPERMEDLAQLFGSHQTTEGCWCTWWLIPVKAFHEAGAAGNRVTMRRQLR